MLNDISHELFITAKSFALLFQKRGSLRIPLFTLFFQLSSDDLRNKFSNVCTFSISVNVVKGSQLLLILGEESLGKGVDNQRDNLIRGIILKRQMDRKTSLHITSTACVRIRPQHSLDQLIGSTKYNGSMQWQGSESRWTSFLFTAGNHPSLTVLGELSIGMFVHLVGVIKLTCLECLEEVRGVFVVVTFLGFEVEPLLIVGRGGGISLG
mmetsp:Transcript_7397/g.16382  ORF Transcript_7397/g.16382 Transcript_7397/m.16382 type:complete len:210 (-) Transcript_7397:255-884(-)